MTIFRIDEEGLTPVAETTFATAGIYERRNIQQYLLTNIEVLGERLMVIAEEFSGWQDSSRRIDILCIDAEANLVVVELKRTDDGGHMELQALRYAAMVSAMTFQQLTAAHARFTNAEPDVARAAILRFLGWPEVLEESFGKTVRIILAAADFGKELTTTVMWLNDQNLAIRCVRLKPYLLADGTVLLDVQQLIPLPEATDYQTQLGEKRRAERESRDDRQSERRAWWAALIERPGAEPHAHIVPKPSPYHFVAEGGLRWAYLLQMQECGVELFVGFGIEAETRSLFDFLLSQREGVESEYGDKLQWEQVGEGQSAKVKYMLAGGYRSPQPEWDSIQSRQVEAMVRLRQVLVPKIGDWRRQKAGRS